MRLKLGCARCEEMINGTESNGSKGVEEKCFCHGAEVCPGRGSLTKGNERLRERARRIRKDRPEEFYNN